MSILFYLIIVLVGIWGINFTLWGTVGMFRWLLYGGDSTRQGHKLEEINEDDIAIITPAHNEEMVIESTISSLLEIAPKERIHIISDGSKDRTADLARSFGVNVLELPAPNGKATALRKGIEYFSLLEKYKAVLFVDADSRPSKEYIREALPFLRDSEVAAVAGHARTLPSKEPLSLWKQFIVAYRERVWFLFQTFIKFGQTTRRFNVSPIISGFASIYKTRVLRYIDIDPPGLVIEDFNMTFEVHKKNLGKIAYHPRVYAYTQDPDTLRDYFKQVRRWNIGFWQTVFHHGIWTSFFWMALTVYITEFIMSSIMMLVVPFVLVYTFSEYTFLTVPYPLEMSIKSIFLVDYFLTVLIAIVYGRPSFLLYGLGFTFMRIVDSVALLYSIPKAVALRSKSKGIWVSPARRVAS